MHRVTIVFFVKEMILFIEMLFFSIDYNFLQYNDTLIIVEMQTLCFGIFMYEIIFLLDTNIANPSIIFFKEMYNFLY